MRKAWKVQNRWSNIVNSCKYIVTPVVTVTWDITHYKFGDTLLRYKGNALIDTNGEHLMNII